MEIASLTPAMEELERMLRWAAQPTGMPAEHRIVPTIQTAGRKRACGWFLRDGWSTREGDLCHEINFVAEELHRPVEDIVEIAVHELAHLWAHSLGLRDCSAGGRHNKVFKEHAENLGLECAKPRDHWGYAHTRLSAELLTRIKADLRPDVAKFALFRLAQGTGKSPTKMLKWACGCTNLRCATQLQATCDRCGGVFIVVV